MVRTDGNGNYIIPRWFANLITGILLLWSLVTTVWSASMSYLGKDVTKNTMAINKNTDIIHAVEKNIAEINTKMDLLLNNKIVTK